MGLFPELRHDLVISEQRQNGRTVFVVKDPVANKFFKFILFQYYVATLLDGRTSLTALQEQVSERMGRPVPLESIDTFVTKLGVFGLLELPASSAGKTSTAEALDGYTVRPARRRSILFYTFPLVNPERGLDRLYPWVSFCFSRPFVIFSVVWVLLALWSTTTDWDFFVKQVAGFRIEPALLLAIYSIVFVVLTIHEIAHGIACRHFGGAVSDMGFMLMYFQPCVYTDVSDSYLFPGKPARMIVMLAGIYSSLMIGATATLLWRITDTSTWFNQMCFLVMAVTGLNLAFNLNPLIKLDGYYILTDWIDIPNLRRKAFDYLKLQGRAIIGLTIPKSLRFSIREHSIYFSYGLLAFMYSSLLIALFAGFMKDFIIEYAPELSMVGLVFGFAALLTSDTKPEETEKTVDPAPRISSGSPVSFRNVAWGVLLFIIILCLIFVETDLRISAPFQLRSRDQAIVRARIAGQMEQIYVDEGDTVQVGQTLARLSTRDLDAELRGVQAQIDQAQAQFALLERGARREEIEQAEGALQEAQTDSEAARIRYERASALAQRQVIAAGELDDARAEFERKQAAVDQAQSRVNLLRAGSRPEVIDAMRARIKELTATADHVAEQQALCLIKSPLTGVVITPFLKERRGTYVEIGDVICELIDHRAMLVEMAVSEREVGDVQVGFPVKFRVQSYPWLSFYGNVSSMAPIAGAQDGRSVVLVRSEIINITHILKSGMTGSAKIYCGPRSLGALMIRRIVRYIRTEFWW